jgi:hypothetical protein
LLVELKAKKKKAHLQNFVIEKKRISEMDNKKQKSVANAAQGDGDESQKSKADLRRERRAIQVSCLIFYFIFDIL